MNKKKKIYFASDFHLGIPNNEESRKRELKITSWLDSIKHDAKEIYLVGDIFDFWFEYKYTIPKGCIRFLGKIGELVDNGVIVHFFTGNHDMWMFNYLKDEFNITIHREPILKEINGKTFLIGHGDGLGPGDRKYKFVSELTRAWHYNWSKFYYYKKNYSYLFALRKIFPNIIKAIKKVIVSFFLFNKKNLIIGITEFYGIISSILCLRSFYRAKK